MTLSAFTSSTSGCHFVFIFTMMNAVLDDKDKILLNVYIYRINRCNILDYKYIHNRRENLKS